MKAIMMSIRPQHVANILNEIKTLEIRKRFPKDYVGWVYIYCTKDKNNLLHKNCAGIWWVEDKDFQKKNKRLGIEQQPIYNGKVIARVWCDKVEEIEYYEDYTCEEWEVGYQSEELTNGAICSCSCLSDDELDDYLQGNNGYAIHIIKVEPFDKPKEISEFKYYKKFSEIDYMLPIPRKETCERLVALTRAPQSFCFIEV